MELKKRFIRVFISSTFRDMMPEREHLMKVVFPELRRRCAAKFLEITEVDLRWGVTDEEASEGKVIGICLNEIDKSRPYFIGILGDRYGWIPQPDDLEKFRKNLESFPWVRNDVAEGMSITEMEIQYGVLRNPQMRNRSFFYIRNAGQNPPAEQNEAARKLLALKKRLTDEKEIRVRSYQQASDMGKQVLDDLWEQIETDYPDSEIPDEHAREKLIYEQLIVQHTGFYSDSGNDRAIVNQRLKENNRLFIYGLPGQGKSALMANLIPLFPAGTHAVYYACGAADGMHSSGDLSRYIAAELKQLFDIPLAIPKNAENPRELLTAFLERVPKESTLVILIDGIEKLPGDNAFKQLDWLPADQPDNIRFVLSGSATETAGLLAEKHFSIHRLGNLTPETVQKITVSYFEHYAKKLAPDLLRILSDFPLAGHPLMLFTLLNELRMFGTHEHLAEFISYYTRNQSSEDFFTAFILRLERDFNDEKFNVKGLLTSLLLSVNGLSETELTEINGVSMLSWAQLQNAIDYHVINKNGLLMLGNQYIKNAVRQHYCAQETPMLTFSGILLRYFDNEHLKACGSGDPPKLSRIVGELPGLAIRHHRTDILIRIIRHMPSLMSLFEERYDTLARLIAYLKNEHSLPGLLSEAVEEYLAGNATDADKMKACFVAGHLVFAHHSPAKAMPFLNAFLEQFIGSHEKSPYLVPALSQMVEILNQTGNVSEAGYILENLIPYLGDEALAEAFDQLGTGYLSTGNFPYAVMLKNDALTFYMHRYGEQHLKTALQLNNLARVHDTYKNYAEAEILYKKSAAVIRELNGPSHPMYQTVQSNLGILYLNTARPGDAETAFEDVLRIRMNEYGENHRLTLKTMNSLGVCKSAMGKTTEAREILLKTARLQSELLGNAHNDTLITMANVADVLENEGDLSGAEALLMEVYSLSANQYGEEHEKTINTLYALAANLVKQERNEDAERMYEKVIGLQQAFYGEDHPFTRLSEEKLKNLRNGTPTNQATAKTDPAARINYLLKEASDLAKDGNHEAAGKHWETVTELVDEHFNGNHPAIFESLNQLAGLYHHTMEFEKAIACADRLLGIASSAFEPGHQAILEFRTLKAMNLFRAGELNAMMDELYLLEPYRDAILNFPKKHIAAMYHEMLGFITGMFKCQENSEKDKERVDALTAQLDQQLDEVLSLNAGNHPEKAINKADEAIATALTLNDTYALAYERPFEFKAVLLENLSKPGEALQTVYQGLAMLSKWMNPLHFKFFNLMKKAGDLLTDSGNPAEAENYFRVAGMINRHETGFPNQQTLDLNLSWCFFYVNTGQPEKALQVAEESIQLSRQLLGNDHETTAWFVQTARELKNG